MELSGRRLVSVVCSRFVDPTNENLEIAFPPLPFSAPLADQLTERLAPFGYTGTNRFENLSADELGVRVEDFLDSCGPNDVVILHIIGHGLVHERTARLLVVGADGRSTPRTDVERWLTAVEGRVSDNAYAGPHVLFLVDLCYAGKVTRLEWQGNIPDEERRAWVIAATGQGAPAFGGRFTAAVSAVLERISAGALDISATDEYVPVQKVAQEIRREVDRLAEGSYEQRVVSIRTDPASWPNFPFIPNPAYRASESMRLAGMRIDEMARPFLDDIDEGLDWLHFASRAAGGTANEVDLDRPGVFRGRHKQLQTIAGILDATSPRPGLALITGSPGVGKSALLGITVCAAYPELSDATERLWRDHRDHLPAVHDGLAAVHCRQRHLHEIVASIARQVRLPLNTTEAHTLITALNEIATTPVIILDALDEAMDPAEVMRTLILPLAGVSRLLVGVRPWAQFNPLREMALAQGLLIDLDAVPVDELRHDLAAYVDDLLRPKYSTPALRRVREAMAEITARILAETQSPDRTSYPTFRFSNDIRQIAEIASHVDFLAGLSSFHAIGDPPYIVSLIQDIIEIASRIVEAEKSADQTSYLHDIVSDIRLIGEMASRLLLEAEMPAGQTDYQHSIVSSCQAIAEIAFRILEDEQLPYPINYSEYEIAGTRAHASGDHWGAFLVAGLFAHYLRGQPVISDVAAAESVAQTVPRTLPEVFELDLVESTAGTSWRRPVLTVLAYSFGAGMPRRLIRIALSVFGDIDATGRSADDDDVAVALRETRFYLRREPDTDRSTLYRLFHQGLADHLRARAAEADPALGQRLFSALLAELGTPIRWSLAEPYLLRHAADHAVAAGIFDDLLADAGYLAYADPNALSANLPQVTDLPARMARVVYSHSFQAHSRLNPDQRRSILMIDAARFGMEELAQRLASVPDLPPVGWSLRWASGITASAQDAAMFRTEETRYSHTETEVQRDDRRVRRAVDHPHRGVVRGVAFDAVGGRLASASKDSSIRIWDPATGTEVRRLEGHRDWVNAVAMSEIDGQPKALTGSSDNTARLWDLNSGKTLQVFQGHTDWLRAVAFGVLDRERVGITAAYDGTVRIWNILTGAPKRTIASTKPLTCLATSQRDGALKIVAGGTDGLTHAWDAESGELITTFIGHLGTVWAVEMSCLDGEDVVFTGGQSCCVQMWRADDGNCVRTFTGFRAAVTALALGTWQDRPILLAGSDDCTVLAWDLHNGRLIAEIAFPSKIGCISMTAEGLIAVGFGHDVAVVQLASLE